MKKEHKFKNGVEYKECSSCKQYKELKEYSRNNRSWDKLKPYCKNCANIKSKEYRQKYDGEIKQRKRIAYLQNKEMESKNDMPYKYITCKMCNKTKLLKYFRKRADYGYNQRCKECEYKINKNYRQSSEVYKKSHRITEQRRRKRNTGNFKRQDWEECLIYFLNKCAYCGKTKSLTQDHIIPVCKGGKYENYNIIPACKSCNSKKHSNNMKAWFRKQPFYTKDKEEKILNYIILCKHANTETK